MGFLSKILKKKEQRPEKIEERKEDVPAIPAVESANTSEKKKEATGVIRALHVTEKTAALGQNRAYVFSVNPTANKIRVKEAVQDRYSVKVEKVRMLTSPGKERRRGRQIGWKPGFKKAIVTLEKGQSIEIQ